MQTVQINYLTKRKLTPTGNDSSYAMRVSAVFHVQLPLARYVSVDTEVISYCA